MKKKKKIGLLPLLPPPVFWKRKGSTLTSHLRPVSGSGVAGNESSQKVRPRNFG